MMSLPKFREELSIHPAPNLPDGQPCWSIQDPAKNRFFRIDWQTFEILVRWSLGDAQKIVDNINVETTLHIELQDVMNVVEFLAENELLIPFGDNVSRVMASKEKAARSSRLFWLLKHYLFFRVPLVRPNNFLESTKHWVEPLFNLTFLRLTLLVFLLSVVLVYRDYERFSQTWVDMFNFQGMLSYALALIFVKVLHELGHAYTAKRYGCNVPSMGVAFLVMWPVAYTDTNDIWKLADRYKRLKVVAAGVMTELIIAVWATLLWTLLPPGTMRDVCFLLSTTTWMMTLLINASPFLRFDGYFFLSDWLDMPNLHQRAFALARWRLRELLFNLKAAPPEYFSKVRTRGLILFAWMTWVYRLVVFLGIALLVYHFFFKILGIVLFAVEIYWFIVRPVLTELLEWRRLLPLIRKRRRGYWSAAVGLSLLMILALPLPTGISAPGTLQSAKIFPIYAPANAQLTMMSLNEGDSVLENQLLFSMDSPELALNVRQARVLLEQQQWAMESGAVDIEQRHDYQLQEQALRLAYSIVQNAEADLRRSSMKATFNGRIRDINPDLKVGVWVHSGEKLGSLVTENSCKVEAYIDEEALDRVHPGDSAIFYTESPIGEYIHLKVIRIDADATRVLPHGLLASQAGGAIKAREVRGIFVPDAAVYRVQLACENASEQLAKQLWRGTVVISGEPQVPLKRYWRAFVALLIREYGF